jgi:hypothetical protein
MKVAKKRRRVAGKKTRTRQHVIAAMSESHLDELINECGYTVEHVTADYGYDAFVFTFDDKGRIENGLVYVQLKATDKLRMSATGQQVLYSISTRDIRLWQDEFMPVYLVLYDANAKVAYWVYLQQYLERKRIRASKLNANTLTIEIEVSNTLSAATIRTWRNHKKKAIAQIKVKHAQ